MVKVVNAIIFENMILTESTNEARLLYEKSAYGDLQKSGQIHLSPIEALYLHSTDKIQVLKTKTKPYEFDALLKALKKIEKNIWLRYCVYRDLRDRGYTVKTALKFGADFRVYDKGIKPGEDHSKWVVFAVGENQNLTWQEFSGKNRVAHSTKKRLMIGIVDDEGDVTYYENRWIKP